MIYRGQRINSPLQKLLTTQPIHSPSHQVALPLQPSDSPTPTKQLPHSNSLTSPLQPSDSPTPTKWIYPLAGSVIIFKYSLYLSWTSYYIHGKSPAGLIYSPALSPLPPALPPRINSWTREGRDREIQPGEPPKFDKRVTISRLVSTLIHLPADWLLFPPIKLKWLAFSWSYLTPTYSPLYSPKQLHSLTSTNKPKANIQFLPYSLSYSSKC